MTPGALDPTACALFLLCAFSLAGLAQAAWLSAPAARRFDWPIDGGRTLRGRRLFGDNKTARGFVVMPAACSAAFLSIAVTLDAGRAGLWPLTPPQYAALGAAAGLGFMLGELPNSFVKRQLDIQPGAPAGGRFSRIAFAALDRVDSPAGALSVLAPLIVLPLATIVWVLIAGPCLHAAFSALTYHWGGKARAI